MLHAVVWDPISPSVSSSIEGVYIFCDTTLAVPNSAPPADFERQKN